MFYCKMLAFPVVTVAYVLGLWLAPFSPFTFALGIPVCCWLVSLFHELGHFAAYRILGLKWKRLTLSCFVLEPEKGLSVDRQKKLFSASCTCAYSAAIPYRRYCIALLSGGITALLLSAGALTIYFFAHGALRTFCLCFTLCGVVNALVNLLLPFSADRRILRQIKGEKKNLA